MKGYALLTFTIVSSYDFMLLIAILPNTIVFVSNYVKVIQTIRAGVILMV